MKPQALILGIIMAFLPGFSHAEADLMSPKDADAIVFKFQTAYADTFNRRDARGMAALFTENATMQNEWGDVTQGQANIESLVARLMTSLQTGTKLEDTSLSSRPVAANVIVSHGISRRMVPGADPVQMFFTRVLVYENGQWKLASTQIARPSTVPKPTVSTPAK